MSVNLNKRGEKPDDGETKKRLKGVEDNTATEQFFSLPPRKDPNIPRLKALVESEEFDATHLVLVILEETGLFNESLEEIANAGRTIGRIALQPYDGAQELRSAALEEEIEPYLVQETKILQAAKEYRETYQPDAKGRVVTKVVEMFDNLYEPTNPYIDSALLTTIQTLRGENFRLNNWDQRLTEAERIARFAIFDENGLSN